MRCVASENRWSKVIGHGESEIFKRTRSSQYICFFVFDLKNINEYSIVESRRSVAVATRQNHARSRSTQSKPGYSSISNILLFFFVRFKSKRSKSKSQSRKWPRNKRNSRRRWTVKPLFYILLSAIHYIYFLPEVREELQRAKSSGGGGKGVLANFDLIWSMNRSKSNGVCHFSGALWWLERRLFESDAYLPSSKQKYGVNFFFRFVNICTLNNKTQLCFRSQEGFQLWTINIEWKIY